ncbi:uncharacterized protein LOC8275759 [Ricinus communis]|uniref:Uncharacterized protein n=1 Tax=Ricinus communis TaxID=3988 RepID=B9R7X9_RICCO|nr:uncharacterized protein LOC8275759 [Ricinus communis]EEF52609.1 conserved hypothetical protein [Ricinus communis]|eukprot:XP_002510422.1 uncharacterized protein LOC8275759 [Ricinus communis]
MASSEFDTLKAEKADAMRRYKRQRIFTLCLHLAVTFALLWWFISLIIPVVEGMPSLYLPLLNHQFVIFGLINTLVFLIYSFSTSNQNHNVSNHNLYDQYVSFSSSYHRKTLSDEEKENQKQTVVSPAPEIIQPEEIIFSDKQIVHYENVAAIDHENQVRDLMVPESTTVDDTEDKRFMRTQSEKYAVEEKKKKRRSQRRVLRRSETEINGREMVVVAGGGDRRHSKSIKDMNNEEFRLTIESFIASKKKSLRDENFAALMQEKEE